MSPGIDSSSVRPASARASTTRWSTVALLVGWAACVLLLAYFLEVRPRLRAHVPGVDTVSTVQAGFPAPPRGAVVYSRQLGRNALALGVVPGADGIVVRASVVGPEGTGVSGLDVTVGTGRTTALARSCGAGCYRAALAVAAGRPRAVDVVVEGDQTARWSVVLPRKWPPRSAASLVGRAEQAWRSLDSLSFDETLGSGSGRVVTSSWRVYAPNRLAYRIAGGSSAVVIGKRRWDKRPGQPWMASAQSPIRQPVPPWIRPTSAHVVGTIAVQGRPALVVTFFDASIPGWFRLVVDRRTQRTLDLHMVAAAHFMHDQLHSFDETRAIRPPIRPGA